MATGRPLRGELEVIRAKGGVPAWHLTTKLPVFQQGDAPASSQGLGSDGGWGKDGRRRAVGVVTISTELAALGSSDQIGASLTRVVKLVRGALGQDPPRSPTVRELAKAAGTSVSTLERNMRKVFGLTPRAYVLQQRINRAMTLLAETDLPIS
jgi:hypothetical protein